jgi:hypothetical protein
MKFQVKYDRRFQTWSYQVSHGVLLLRSNIGRGYTERVDVMFRGVTALRLRSVYQSLAVDVVASRDVSDLVGSDIEAMDSDSHAFSVGAIGEVGGFVVAASCHLAEDDMEYGEPSSIDHPEFAARVKRSGDFP